MKKQSWLKSWPRLLLWFHVLGTVGFYLVLWLRTAPAKNDRAGKLQPMPEEPLQTTDCPMVSIIVPARNEERNIRRCVSSLLEQRYDNYEVIVVDDGSTDETPSILDALTAHHRQSNRLYVLRLRDQLPEGWAGKPYALHKGVQEAHGEWLLFTDADTWHNPDALRTAVTEATREHIDLLSFGTQQELPGFWDKVTMPLAYIGITMQYPPRKINDPLSPIALANGQYILIRRAVYEKIGGYDRPELRNTLLDDRDLARFVKASGFRLRMVDGRDLVHVHMYQGLKDIWQGWRKNAFLGSRGGIAFTVLQLIGLPMISIVPFLLPLMLWVSWLTTKSAGRPQGLARVVSCARRGGGGGGCGEGTLVVARAGDHRLFPLPYTPSPVGAGSPCPPPIYRLAGRADKSALGTINRPLQKNGSGREPPYTRITPGELSAATLLELLPLLAYKRWVDKELEIPWYYAFTFPLAGALFEGILAQSAWRILTCKGVDWRGRQYYNGKGEASNRHKRQVKTGRV